ncbi:hypothetical protein BHE74_00012239 [Ensete ventricosum]|nr:hypothetical protein BHE74_00012239 [Ensete ventricosum]
MPMSSIDVAAGPRKQKLAGHGGKEQVTGERPKYEKREGEAVDEGAVSKRQEAPPALSGDAELVAFETVDLVAGQRREPRRDGGRSEGDGLVEQEGGVPGEARLGGRHGPGDGILKLRDDVQMCGSQDVQVMWEMVRRSETAVSQATKRHKRQFWRPSACSSRTSACDDPTEPSHHH